MLWLRNHPPPQPLLLQEEERRRMVMERMEVIKMMGMMRQGVLQVGVAPASPPAATQFHVIVFYYEVQP